MWYIGFGTDLEEHVHEGWQSSDLGFIGIGETRESVEDVTNILVVKVDVQGTQQWMREIGTRNKWDVGFCVKETAGGYIVFTDTDSESPPRPNNYGFLRISPDTISQNK